MLLSRVNPSVVLPGLLVPQVQKVDFEKYIGSKTNMIGTAEEMLYLTTVNHINSETSVGQQWNSELTNQSYSLGQVSLPAYRINAYLEYTEDEQAKFEKLSSGVSLPNFLENLAMQGINQRKHQGILFGFDGTLNQGVMANATTATMPADSNSKSTLIEYDTAELSKFLADTARGVMDSSYGMLKPLVIASSVRVINYLKTALIPIMDSANSGSVDSVAGLYNRVIGEWLGVGKVEFIADELLKNASNGKDLLVFIAPGMDTQGEGSGTDVNQNLVGDLNGISYNTMYDAGQGLVRKDRPDDFGSFSSLLTYKMTPGATLRSEAVVKIEVQYS